MTELNLKTSLTAAEKFVVAFGITFVGICVSMVIGQNLLFQLLLSPVVLFLITGRRPTIVYASVLKFRRDVALVKLLIRLMIRMKMYEFSNETVPNMFRKQVAVHANKNMIVSDDKIVTYQEADSFMNQIARYFKRQGYQKGDTIALLMENRVEFPLIWVGLSKLGIVTSLINTNLRKEALIHSIRLVSSKAIIVSAELLDSIKEIRTHEDIKDLQIFVYDNKGTVSFNDGLVNLYQELKDVSSESVDNVKGSVHDKLIYIYTSGTTGLPKAVNVTHFRYSFVACAFNGLIGFGSKHVVYTPLPLYHTAGGVIGMGNAILYGCTCAIRKKFSASNFWTDCKKFNCTVAQYIGELCRYLLLTPPKPSDTDHNVQLIVGNGLRAEIWSQFQERFKVKQILEVYGATESNANLVNNDNTLGSIGFVPQGLAFLAPVTLLKYDKETYEPLRDVDGFCMPCDYGEPGILVGMIRNNNPYQRFCGYSDKKSSDKKIITDVFRKGDSYFNSGDILAMDIFGSMYFKDRVGDTFRWKGENVSTMEVEAAIIRAAKLSDCTVYGVAIPGADGKAGMVTIVDPDNKLDLDNLANEIKESLPGYARPIFIRIANKADLTATFKLRKVDLQREGFDITKIKDTIYIVQRDGSYKKMTQDDFEMIQQGMFRL